MQNKIENLKKELTDVTVAKLYELIDGKKFEVEAYKPKLYKEDTIWDEDKSVKWNREETVRVNTLMKNDYEKVKELKRELIILEKEFILTAYANEKGLTKEQVKPIYEYAYAEKHAYGIREILYAMDDVVDVVKNVISKG